MIALEMSLRGLLRNFGLKVGAISRGRFEARIRDLAADNPMLVAATEPMLRARASLRQELAGLERRVRQRAQDDPVCHRLMSVPGIGAVVALTFRLAVNDPARFTSSKKVGPWVGLTPPRNQSGERDVSGGITRAGDVTLRRALCQAATVMMHARACDMAGDMGGTGCPAPREEACHGRPGTADWDNPASDVASWHRYSGSSHRSPHAAQVREALSVACLPAGLRGPPGTRFRRCRGLDCCRLTGSSTPTRWAGRNCIEPASCWQSAR